MSQMLSAMVLKAKPDLSNVTLENNSELDDQEPLNNGK